jgi:hypothetical protein
VQNGTVFGPFSSVPNVNDERMKVMMQVCSATKVMRIAAVTAILAAIAGTASAQATGPANPPAAGAASSVQLQPYTTPDTSASVGVPAGWNVTKGENGVIQMSGPQGEMISLGNGVFVKNGPFQPGQKMNGPISLTMPYQATLAQKYAMIWKEASIEAGDPTEQVNIISGTPIPLGKIAQCGIFLGSQTNKKGPSKFESRFCSLPMDTNGIFKLFWMNATLPAAVAAQERATAEAVLASYKPSPASLKLILQPATPPMPPPPSPGGLGGGGGESSAAYAARMADQSSTCMDLGVIREVPERRLPDYCQ